jgi:hypothetical protein
LDRDLETVVLRCLEKEPGRRYPSAEALADDLERWLRGEPILARPVGQGERFWRWCRRNPVVSSLTAAVAASLVIGIIVSTYFAVQASRRALAETWERRRAETAERDAIAARDHSERLFARSLAMPLDPDAASDARALSFPETEALWELAAQKDRSLRLVFLDEATRNATAVRQLGARSQPALIAAIGLDPTQCERASDRLESRLRDRTLQPAQKAGLALVARELIDQTGPKSAEYAGIVVNTFGTGPSERERVAWREHILSASDWLEPSIAAGILTDMLASETRPQQADFRRQHPVANALIALAQRMAPAEAARRLLGAIERGRDASSRGALSKELASMTRLLAQEEGTKLCDRAARVLVDSLKRETDSNACIALSLGLVSLLVRLDRDVADRLAASVKDRVDSSVLATNLMFMAGRKPPREAALSLVSLQSEMMESFSDGYQISVTWRLESSNADVRRHTMREARVFEWSLYKACRNFINASLGEDVDRMGAADALRVCKPAGEILAEAVKLTPGFHPKDSGLQRRAIMAAALAVVARGMDRADAFRICRQVAQISAGDLKRETNPVDRGALAEALADVAGHMEASDAARVCGQAFPMLADSLQQADSSALEPLTRGLATLARHLDRSEAARLCGQVVTRHTKDEIWGVYEEDLASLVGQMDPVEVLRIVSSVLKPDDAELPRYLAFGLVTLAGSGRMEPNEAVRVLTRSMEHTTDSSDRQVLARAIAEASGRLKPSEAAHACTRVARFLTEALSREKDVSGRHALVEGLSTVASRMSEPEKSRICEGAVRSLLLRIRSAQDESGPDAGRLDIDRDLSVLLPRLDPGTASHVARELVARICSERSSDQSGGDQSSKVGDLLNALLSDAGDAEKTRRATRMAIGSLVGGPVAAGSVTVEPFPCRLSTQELVEMLKMPTYFGHATRVVLDHLCNRYGRRFVNHWAFVRFAREQKLGLDFTTPPKRPDPHESFKRMLEALGERGEPDDRAPVQ